MYIIYYKLKLTTNVWEKLHKKVVSSIVIYVNELGVKILFYSF